MSTADEISVPDEETTLLLHRDVPPKRTPLPMFQILVLLSVLLTETITFSSIPPYINQMMSELPIVGGDQRKVGYYTGITVRLFSFDISQVPMGVHASQLDDRFDHLVRALALFLDPGSLPLFGWRAKWERRRCISRPQDHWPDYFPQPFWAEYLYFFPCLVVASFFLMQFAIAATFFEETLDRRPSTTGRSGSQTEERVERPPPLHSLLTRPVVISIANQAVLVFLNIAALGLAPASIGLCMSVYGCISAISLFVLFLCIIAHFGPRRVVVAAVAAMGVIYALYPLENMLARGTVTVAIVWPLVVLQLLSLSVGDMGFSSILMCISSSPPNKRSLGAANGLA
ncbi:MFS general substrate transporter [Lactarius hatsudake]|nr:MFS general substrate transporter [Lactarius hatsudake]